MICGTYTATYTSNLGLLGVDVVRIQEGRISGGLRGFSYGGAVHEAEGCLSARVEVRRIEGSDLSVFGGLVNFDLNLRGWVKGNTIELTGEVEGQPELTIGIKLSRLAETVA